MRNTFGRLLLLAGILLGSLPGSLTCSAQGAPQRIELTAKRFTFDPGEITLKIGQPVVLVLKSADVAHGLRIRELGVDITVKAGGTAQVHFTPSRAGNFVAHCSVFCGSGHGTMVLKVHVAE